jgi:hypothetical protein
MSSASIALAVFASLTAAMLLGMWLRRLLPEHHLIAESRDTVKLAMGLVATMAGLLLGLMVSAAQGSYDTIRREVIELSAKVAFLDRALEVHGPDAAEARAQLREVVEQVRQHLWSNSRGPAEMKSADALYATLQRLPANDDVQRAAKAQAIALAAELGQLRALVIAQSIPSISLPLLIVVISWLAILSFSFSLLAPRNATTAMPILLANLSVSAAIFLVLELDRPFGGLIRISSETIGHAMGL